MQTQILQNSEHINSHISKHVTETAVEVIASQQILRCRPYSVAVTKSCT